MTMKILWTFLVFLSGLIAGINLGQLHNPGYTESWDNVAIALFFALFFAGLVVSRRGG